VLKVFNLKTTELDGGLSHFQDIHACPLVFLGCTFMGPGDIYKHLETHELVERSKGYHAIISCQRWWPSRGKTTCPICKEQKNQLAEFFPEHLASKHSKEERAEHRLEISEMLQPYLSREERVRTWWRDQFNLLRKEFEESGSLTEIGS